MFLPLVKRSFALTYPRLVSHTIVYSLNSGIFNNIENKIVIKEFSI